MALDTRCRGGGGGGGGGPERGDPAATNSGGGVTSATSPAIALTGSTTYQLAFQSYLAHGTNSSSADFLRVRVLSGTNFGTSTTVLDQRGAAVNRNGAWARSTVNLSQFAGQSVRIIVEAVDDVVVTGQ